MPLLDVFLGASRVIEDILVAKVGGRVLTPAEQVALKAYGKKLLDVAYPPGGYKVDIAWADVGALAAALGAAVVVPPATGAAPVPLGPAEVDWARYLIVKVFLALGMTGVAVEGQSALHPQAVLSAAGALSCQDQCWLKYPGPGNTDARNMCLALCP